MSDPEHVEIKAAALSEQQDNDAQMLRGFEAMSQFARAGSTAILELPQRLQNLLNVVENLQQGYDLRFAGT